VVSTLARILPHSLAYLLGETMALACFLLCAGRRRNLLRNLKVVLSGQDQVHSRRLALHIMLNFGRSVVETFMIPHLTPEQIDSKVSIIGKATLDSLTSSGRGAVLVTAHIGSWELAGIALAGMGYEITTVAGIQFTPSLSPFVRDMKASRGISVVSPGKGILKLPKALRGGGFVALHIDGDQFMGGIETEMFGTRTRLPRGPAALALKTNAAVVPAFSVRTSRDRLLIIVESEIPTEGENEVTLTKKIAIVVEEYIRRHIDQWCIFRPMWGSRL
jgi:lauroyl/myristoyl acyltransferase